MSGLSGGNFGSKGGNSRTEVLNRCIGGNLTYEKTHIITIYGNFLDIMTSKSD